MPPEMLLAAYAQGSFPMAESRDARQLFWLSPDPRGIIPMGGFHISRSLARRMRGAGISAGFNLDFQSVVTMCADREETWINPALFEVYATLHRQGHAHSAEVHENGTLIGGVFGIAIGGAFFGESMFSRSRDGSKMALAILHDHLLRQGFTLFDTQFLTPHLASLGGVEIPRAAYLSRLAQAIRLPVAFAHSAGAGSGSSTG